MLAYQYALATRVNIDLPFQVTTMDDDGEQHDLTFEDLHAYVSCAIFVDLC